MSLFTTYSFVEKIMRAEKHIDDLKVEFAEYAASHPYTVRTVFESKNDADVHRLQFIRYPDSTQMPLIVGDAVYNLRAALDHLMAALVPKSRQRKVYFPILFKGVWEDDIPGEKQQRTGDRSRWRSYIKGVQPEAVAILKDLQPRDGARNDDPTINFLIALNGVAIKDRHVKLPFIAPSLGNYRVTGVLSDGTVTGWDNPDVSLEDGAEIRGLPEGTMDVQIEGTPVISVEVGGPGRNLQLPNALDEGAAMCQELIVARLLPFVRS